MHLCSHCLKWAPTSRRELAIRKSNSPETGEKPTPPCPKCGGTAWLYTSANITPNRYPMGFLARWYWRVWRKAI
jgi:hypothetical protein